MNTVTLRSDDARLKWRDTVDTAFRGTPVIIERYNKPVAVLVGHDEWLALRAQHLALLNERSAAVKEGNFVTWEDVKAQMLADGLLNE